MIYETVSGAGLPARWQPASNGAGSRPYFLVRNNAGRREDYTRADGTLIRFKNYATASMRAAMLSKAEKH